jgi:hypothetical protein
VNGRPRVRFVTGGPSWEERKQRQLPTPRNKLPKKQRAALKQLDASITGLKVALRHEQVRLARQLRSAAWEQVELLPHHLTYDQRRALYEAKLAIHVLAARQRRERGT